MGVDEPKPKYTKKKSKEETSVGVQKESDTEGFVKNDRDDS